MPKQITGTLNAFVSTKYSIINPADLHKVKNATQDQKNALLGGITLTHHDFGEDGDFIPVGTAEVTLTLTSADDMVKGQVSALKAQRQKTMAEAQREVNRIDEQISKLQALTFDGGA